MTPKNEGSRTAAVLNKSATSEKGATFPHPQEVALGEVTFSTVWPRRTCPILARAFRYSRTNHPEVTRFPGSTG